MADHAPPNLKNCATADEDDRLERTSAAMPYVTAVWSHRKREYELIEASIPLSCATIDFDVCLDRTPLLKAGDI